MTSSSNHHILITGATGFVGRALLARLSGYSEYQLIAIVRHLASGLPAKVEVVGDIGPATDWSSFLPGVGTVVHAAARVHIMNDCSYDSLSAFRAINTLGTLNLARQAADKGVRRFIFVSSVKVNGEATLLGKPFLSDDVPAPEDAYGISKREAEDGLRRLAVETGMEVVIIRPALVYGPGVKANFLSMMRWLYRGVPLPFGAIPNKRSFAALDNLVDLIVTCINHPAAANQTFFVSDGEDLSTTDLLRRMGLALSKPVRLIPVPVFILQAGAALFGKRAVAQRLCSSLQVDISKTRSLLDWSPPVSVDEGLRRTARMFLDGL